MFSSTSSKFSGQKVERDLRARSVSRNNSTALGDRRPPLIGFLLLLAGIVSLARADQWAPNLTVAATWNDNASNANLSSDVVSALQTSADLIANERYTLSPRDAAHFGLHATAEWWPDYQLLNQYALGARIDWEHKFGLGALAPVFSLELAGDLVGAKDNGRRGTATGVTLALRKKFNDLWRASLTQEFNQLYARGAVYDRTAAITTAEISRDLSPEARVTLAVFYRRGDIVSFATPPRPDIVSVARVRENVSTFDRSMVAYSVDARTWGGKASLVRAVNESSAVIFGYEYRATERSPLRYANHLVSLALVHQF